MRSGSRLCSRSQPSEIVAVRRAARLVGPRQHGEITKNFEVTAVQRRGPSTMPGSASVEVGRLDTVLEVVVDVGHHPGLVGRVRLGVREPLTDVGQQERALQPAQASDDVHLVRSAWKV
jgi:hypothetical protein